MERGGGFVVSQMYGYNQLDTLFNLGRKGSGRSGRLSAKSIARTFSGKDMTLTYQDMINSETYGKTAKAYSVFRNRLSTLKIGADALSQLDDVAFKHTKEAQNQISERGKAFAKAFGEIRHTFVDSKLKESQKLIQKMEKELEKGEEYWKKVGLSIQSNGNFSLDTDKFSKAIAERPQEVLSAVKALKNMGKSVKVTAKESIKDKNLIHMAWRTEQSDAQLKKRAYGPKGDLVNPFLWEGRGSMVNGFF